MAYLSSVVLLYFLVLSGTALAENGHSYNGSFCKPWQGTQSGDFRYDYDGIFNTSNGSRWINCPLIEDEIDADLNAVTKGTTQVWAHYTGAGTIYCYLYSNRTTGTPSGQVRSSSRVGTGWLDVDPTAITYDDYWGDYGMYCYVPSQGKLNMIWFGEKT